jgi:hypothetical protein
LLRRHSYSLLPQGAECDRERTSFDKYVLIKVHKITAGSLKLFDPFLLSIEARSFSAFNLSRFGFWR